ncbi:hypothetical protein KMZ29_06250 [Bradyrhizobium sediminis]|uniref:Uncharacterized protein n=1 Tax=Bradyrhizobium sediminis TaxID=2840469 RepID=A0A975NFN5_9BRAD|nr:hypothetical protein [Bradyrhizobium sediminis]QWG14282.1 hypothetical protein KMZ29_06250 [Bradyrhizobium sediminis]
MTGGQIAFAFVVAVIVVLVMLYWDERSKPAPADPEADELLAEIAALQSAADDADRFAAALRREHAELTGPRDTLRHAIAVVNAARTGWHSMQSQQTNNLRLQQEVLVAAHDRDSRWIDAFLMAQARSEIVGGGKERKDLAGELQGNLRALIEEKKADGAETRTLEELLRALDAYTIETNARGSHERV